MCTINRHNHTDYTCGFTLLGLNQIRMRYTDPSGSGLRLQPFWLNMQQGGTRSDGHKRVWRGNVLGGREWGQEGQRSKPAGQHTRGFIAGKRRGGLGGGSAETVTLNWWDRLWRACVMVRGNWQVTGPSLWTQSQWSQWQWVKTLTLVFLVECGPAFSDAAYLWSYSEVQSATMSQTSSKAWNLLELPFNDLF